MKEAIRRYVIKRDGSICQGCGCLCKDRLRNGRGKPAYTSSTVYLGLVFSYYRASIDHIIPTKHGGTDDVSNLQLLCVGCNAAKSDRLEGSAWRRQW